MNGILRRKSTLRSSVDQNSDADKNLPTSATEDSTSTSTGSCNASNFDDGLPMNPGSRICSSAAAANSGHCSNLILGGGSGCGGSRGSGVDLSGGLGGSGGGGGSRALKDTDFENIQLMIIRCSKTSFGDGTRERLRNSFFLKRLNLADNRDWIGNTDTPS